MGEALVQYLFPMLIPLGLVMYTCLCMQLSQVFSKLLKGRVVLWTGSQTWNFIGNVGNGLIVVAVTKSVLPFRCYDHPIWFGSDRASLIEFPNVLCWEGGP